MDSFPLFLLKYNRSLLQRATASLGAQVNDLEAQIAQGQAMTSQLKSLLESRQTESLESSQRVGEQEVELKLKDIEIERLKRKALKDSEGLREEKVTLEEKLSEKEAENRGLREVQASL